MKANQNKIKKIYVLLISAVIVGAVTYFILDKNNGSNENNIIGEITALEHETVTLKHDNIEYNFIYEDIVGDKLTVGMRIIITFNGTLDNQEKTQNVLIKELQILENNQSSNTDINNIVANMTIEEKVGQMFMVRVPDTNQVELIDKYQFGGYILFDQDFENKTMKTVKANIASYQAVAKIPLLIGTDEEGGTVVRASSHFRDTTFKAPQDIYTNGGMRAIIQDIKDKDTFLKDLGVNVNFAPVCDVSTNPDDFIYQRSFGKNAQETSKYIENVVSTMEETNMGSVLKHFPGYGNNIDTHSNVAHDKRTLKTFQKSDFLPFQAGIKAGGDSVLVSHNVMECIDPNNPSSLSLEVHQILRNDLQFKGVIMTDDLKMDGVKAYGSSQEIAIKAILAGNDMLISSDAVVQSKAVIQAVKDGRISKEQIDESVIRILTWKKELGLIK